MKAHWVIPTLILTLSLLTFAAPPKAPSPAPSATSPLAVFRSIKESPDAVAFSPDGSRLLSASGFELLLWDVASARPIRRLEIPEMFRDFTTCAFSPDGKTVLAGSNDGKVATWDTETGALGKVLDSEDWMYGCAFSRDGSRVLSVYQSGLITYREMATGQILWKKKSSRLASCALSADGKRALTATEDGMEYRDAATGEILRTIAQPGASCYQQTADLSPDGSLIVCPSSDRSSRFLILDTRSGKILRTFKGHKNAIQFLGFSPDGSMIASGATDNTLKLWNPASGKLIRTFSGHNHDVLCAAFLADSSKILSASVDLSMKLWDCRRATIPAAEHAASLAVEARNSEIDRVNGYVEPVLTIAPEIHGYKFGIEDSAFSPDGKTTISCGLEPVKIHNASTGALLLKYTGHPQDDEAFSCVFSPDGQKALSCGRDQTLKLWDAHTGKTLRTFVGHSSYVPDAAFSPNGSRIVSVSWDKSAKVWDAVSGKELLKIGGYNANLEGCAYLPDGKSFLVTSGTSGDKTVRFYYADDGALLRNLVAGYEVTAFAISPDGGRLFTGSAYDAEQTLWDLGSGKPSRIPKPAKEYVHCAAFSPDGKWLVTGSLDQGIRIRDGATGALALLVRSRAGHSDAVDSISFRRDGKQILTGSRDGNLKIWDFQQLLDSRQNQGKTDTP